LALNKIEHFSKISPYLTTILAEEDTAKKGAGYSQ